MKFFYFTITLLFLMSSAEISTAQSKELQKPASLNHIALYVADLKVATDFYNDLLDLKQIENPFNDGMHTWFSLGPGAALHIISGAKVRGTYFIEEHLCFSVHSIDSFIEKLKSKNISYFNFNKTPGEITLRPDGVRQVYIQDPDGHWLEVNDAKK